MKNQDNWIMPFDNLDLFGGNLITLINDDEDMLEIHWDDGMWIDVGYIADEARYYITTVSDDTMEAWNNPLSVIKVKNRDDLLMCIQQEIKRCRM